jgi:hypothetical protein
MEGRACASAGTAPAVLAGRAALPSAEALAPPADAVSYYPEHWEEHGPAPSYVVTQGFVQWAQKHPRMAAHARPPPQCAAFLRGRHPRLGACSPVRRLDSGLAKTIADMAAKVAVSLWHEDESETLCMEDFEQAARTSTLRGKRIRLHRTRNGHLRCKVLSDEGSGISFDARYDMEAGTLCLPILRSLPPPGPAGLMLCDDGTVERLDCDEIFNGSCDAGGGEGP